MPGTRSALLIVALAMTLVPGCCCKKGCGDLSMYTIKLNGFTLEETDSVVVVTRLFASEVPLTDTTLAFGTDRAHYGPAELDLHIPDLGNPHLQREIIFPRIGRSYHIDGIELEMAVCNKCFALIPADHTPKMAKHRVDGVWGTGGITLYR